MPRISYFYGIEIYMYWADHGRPHLHAIYGGEEAVFAIGDGEMMAGVMRRRTAQLVRDWIALRRDALLENWRRGQDQVPFEQIDGLDDE